MSRPTEGFSATMSLIMGSIRECGGITAANTRVPRDPVFPCASTAGKSWRTCSGLFELAHEHRFGGAHARFFGELFERDAHLTVAARLFGDGHVEGLPALLVDREGSGADAASFFAEPED